MKFADLQANISVLKQESLDLSHEISEKHKSIRELDSVLAAKLSEFELKHSEIDRKNEEINSKKRELEVYEKRVNSSVLDSESKIKEIENKIKQKNKELSKINEWCLQGDESLNLLIRKQEEINDDIEKGKRTLVYIESLSCVKSKLEEEIDTLRKEFSSISQVLENKIAVSNQLLKQEQSNLDKIRQTRELEEIAYYNIRERKVRVENDISIYIGRASTIYKKAFPELEMKL